MFASATVNAQSAADLAKQQKELEANLQKQLQLQMQYNAAHHSFNKKWGGFSSSELATFNSLFGTNWNGQARPVGSDGCIILYDGRVWEQKNYLHPIPGNEYQLNKNLGQNPGWES